METHLGLEVTNIIKRSDPVDFRRRCMWPWLKIKQEGQTAGFGPCFDLPGFHFGYRFFEPQPCEYFLGSPKRFIYELAARLRLALVWTVAGQPNAHDYMRICMGVLL